MSQSKHAESHSHAEQLRARRHPYIDVERLMFLCLVLLISLSLLRSKGTGDMEIWKRWADNALNAGPVTGFALNAADYPPLCTAILFAVAKLGKLAGVSSFLAIKWSLWSFLTASALLAGILSRSWLIAVVLQLSLLLNSVALGYVDIYFVPPLLLGFFLLERGELVAASIAFGLACSTKWQPLILMPFVLLYVLQIRSLRAWRRAHFSDVTLRFLMPLAGVALAMVSIFDVEPILSAFRASLDHKFLSGNALNYNWLATHYLHVFESHAFGPLDKGLSRYVVTDDPRLTFIPKLAFKLFYGAALIAWFRQEKTFANLLAYSSVGFFAYFMWNTGVHENHLFTVSLLAVIWFYREPAQWVTQLSLVMIANLNLYLFYGATGSLAHSRVVAGNDISVLGALYALIFFLALWGRLVIGGLTTKRTRAGRDNARAADRAMQPPHDPVEASPAPATDSP